MKNLNSEIFKKNEKRNRNILIVGILLLIITGSLIYLGIKNENKKLPTLYNMSDIISDKRYNKEFYSYIDVATKPYLFAVYEEDGIEELNKFYLVMDKDNYLYILYMGEAKYNELNVDSIKENPIRVTGLTKKIPNDIKQLAIESYNEIMDDEYLTESNYEQYAGLVYLDTVSPINDSTLFYLGAFLSGFFFLLIIIIYIVIVLKNKKLIKKLSDGEISKLDAELSGMNDSKYSKMNFYLLKDYLVDMTNNIVILNYLDILWAYPYEQRYNGMLINKCLKIVDKNNKRYEIASTKLLDKNKDEILQEILEALQEKNKDIILGFNKENKNIVKEKFKNLKASNKENNKL